ncbi:hypothetical protein [Mycolicibacter kumamotonensis]|uniref:Uncharacterized protein n=1 Tax=Mycolicibacter kumamotonensis TaxID=354243 RepID=A0A1B8SDJ5_9MYCO|nr:hypothetical protein [Mycolicibacter kumamotonensis]OBY30795.1 hypothetical protein ACT18_15805 [Mycolicibacter kumamotonensis]
MTTSASSTTDTHPRTRSMESWRARLGVLASRGETDGPRVEEARTALSWWRTRAFLIREGSSPEQADELLDLIDRYAADAATDDQAVAR